MLGFRIFLLLFVLLDVCWWLWADALLRSLRHRLTHARLWRILLGLFILVQLAGVIVRIIAPGVASGVSHVLPVSLLASQYLWHLLVLPITFLATMIVRLVGWSASSIRSIVTRQKRAELTASAATGLSRRQLLGLTAVALPPLIVAGLTSAAMAQAGRFRIRRVRLGIPELPPNLEGLKIAQVSDIHVGRFFDPRMLPAVVEATNPLRADLVLLTGDLIDFSLADLPCSIDAVKKKDAAHCLALCVGNHDVIEDGAAFIRQVRAAGIPVLSDGQLTLRIANEQVQLLGLPWSRGQDTIDHSLARLMRLRRAGAFPILMAHHPHAFDPAAAVGLPLTLSGHTHGGQLMLTDQIGAGPLFYRYWSGLYQKGRSSLFVSNGVGNWFPLRINAPAEIVEITLTRSATL